ncbi:MAG: flavin reductase family protein [Acidimicrobiales bacterium]
MHQVITPTILYLATPVVLISTMNEDGSVNLAPASSVWRLDQTGVLGRGTRALTFANLRRDGECARSLPSVDQVAPVDRLALAAGIDLVTDYKLATNFRHVRDKFDAAGRTALPSQLVGPPRAIECPLHLEAKVTSIHSVGAPEDHSACIEVQIVRVHVEEGLLDDHARHHISSDRWRALIMSFLNFYGLGDRVHGSRLAEVF